GESAASFATRSGFEALLPAFAGAAIGGGIALLALSSLAPGGTIGGTTISSGLLRAAIGGALAIVCVACGVGAAYPRSERPARRRRRLPPWELAPLAAAIALLVRVLTGGGLAHDSTGASYPRLEVFLLPVLAVAAVAGLAARVARRSLRARREPRRAWLLLPLRRLGAARGLLVAVVVGTAAAAGSFAYASTLTASLSRSTAEKAYVANGSDVQAFVDPHFKLYTHFAFPLALVEVDELDLTLPSGQPVDLVAGDPAALARTLHGWKSDPRPLLARLADARAGTLAAIATPGAPHITSIVDQGAHIPVTVVGHAIVPGVSAGRPGVLVSRAALARYARRDNFLEPAPSATGLLWARGDVRTIEAAIVPSNLEPAYLTTPAHIYDDPSVAATERSYRYVRVIGAAAAVLSLVALLLYLQARQQAQLIATALTRRMGLTQLQDLLAVALEAAAIVAFAAVVGAVVAVAAARPIVHHVDGLASYAPSAAYVVPWALLVVAVAVGVVLAALLGAAAVAIAGRSDAAEELRVA
ncbi:MAG TPA: FtsX-like permease family protein, partial [Gaiellaceae bacterium]